MDETVKKSHPVGETTGDNGVNWSRKRSEYGKTMKYVRLDKLQAERTASPSVTPETHQQ